MAVQSAARTNVGLKRKCNQLTELRGCVQTAEFIDRNVNYPHRATQTINSRALVLIRLFRIVDNKTTCTKKYVLLNNHENFIDVLCLQRMRLNDFSI